LDEIYSSFTEVKNGFLIANDLDKKLREEMSSIGGRSDEIGVPCELSVTTMAHGEGESFRGSHSQLFGGAAVDVCKSLNILRQKDYAEPIPKKPKLIVRQARYEIRLLEFTEPGFEFMLACRRKNLKKA
jgi:hypothetical protein